MYLKGRALAAHSFAQLHKGGHRIPPEGISELERKVGQGFRGFSHLRAVASANGREKRWEL